MLPVKLGRVVGNCSETGGFLMYTKATIWMFPQIVGFPPKSSILIGFSIINHPFWGFSPYFLETPVLFREDIVRENLPSF